MPFNYRVVFLTGPTQKSSKYGTGPPQQEKMTKYTGPTQDLLTQKSSKYGTGTPQQEKLLSALALALDTGFLWPYQPQVHINVNIFIEPIIQAAKLLQEPHHY